MLCLVAAMLFTLPATTALADEEAKAQILVDQARVALMDFMADKDMEWLQNNLKTCKAVFVVPSLLKAGFVWGGSGGSGVLMVHDEDTRAWNEPVFYGIGSVSWGLQIGASESQVILAVVTQRGLESLYKSSFKLGGDVSIAAGPVGGGAGGKGITADMASFARAKGAYAGLALDGAVIKVSDKHNAAYFSKAVRPTDVIIKKAV